MLKNNNKGLTVVELIVVIGFMSLLLSMAVLKIDRNHYYMLADARTLRDNLREIKYLTMTEGDASLKITFDKNFYRVKQGSKILKTIDLKPGLKINNNFNYNTISFVYSGSPAGAGGTVSVFDEISKKYCEITIVPDTGRIILKNTIFEGYKEK